MRKEGRKEDLKLIWNMGRGVECPKGKNDLVNFEGKLRDLMGRKKGMWDWEFDRKWRNKSEDNEKRTTTMCGGRRP
jgi:hypothetical protein